SLQDVQRLTYGSDPLHPSPQSLIGQYLEATGASTLVRTFPAYPERDWDGRGEIPEGPEKLVVALSPPTLPIYLEIFGREEFLVHVHRPHQDTLVTGQKGYVGTYGNHSHRLEYAAG